MAPVDAPIRAGLIFQQKALAERLRQTLVEAGINIDAEYNVESLRTADLNADNIEVYIVNLEPEIEDLLDEVTDLLEDLSMPVVFNDAGVSSDLSGWDQARWARHLASKIRKGRGNLPPPPANAEAIPTPAKAAPATVPAAVDPVQAGADEGAIQLAQVESPSEPQSTAETTSTAEWDLQATDVETLPSEPSAADTPSDAAPHEEQSPSVGDLALAGLDLLDSGDSTELQSQTVAEPSGAFDFDTIDEQELETLDLLSEEEGAPPESVGGDRAAYAAELAAGLLDSGEKGAAEEGWLNADSAAALDDQPDLSWDEPLPSEPSADDSLTVDPGDGELLADLLDDPAGEGSDLEVTDLGIDELIVEEELGADLEGIEESPDDTSWDTGSDMLSELEGFADSSVEIAEPTQVDDSVSLHDSLGLDIDLEVPDSPPEDDGLVDLDAILSANPEPAPESAQAEPNAPAEASDDSLELAQLPDLDSWSLEPMDDGSSAAETPAVAPSSQTPTKRVEPIPTPESVLADLQLNLDALGLVPMEGEEADTAAPASAGATAPASPAVDPDSALLDDLGALDFDLEPPAEVAAPTSRDPAPSAAPAAEAEGALLDELDALDFDLEPPTEASETESAGVDSLDDLATLDFDLEPPSPADPEPPPSAPAVSELNQPVAQAGAAASKGPRKIVVLGASIGGPDSIRNFLSKLNTGLGAAFILVQHMGAEFLDLMAQQLDRVSPLDVQLARHGQELREGAVVIAPVGQRLSVDADGKLDLSAEAGHTAYSPSIDQVLTDSLQRWGAERLLVIIFSGMASDAVAGAKQLAAAGTPIWAQDPASCVISSMVDGVVAAKVVSFIGSPEQLAEQANKLLA